MRRRRRASRRSEGRRALRNGAALASSAFLLAGCELPSFGAPSPASEQGEQIYDLYRWFFAAAVAVGVFVISLITFTLVRYRRRGDEVPTQKPDNVPLEVLYTAVPLLIVGVLFAFSVRTEISVNEVSDSPDHVVEVVGFQWQWQFRYPASGHVVTGTPESGPPELVLPRGRTTRLELASTDVNHSFWVPRFLNKRDVIPGLDDQIDVTPTETGEYDGVCAEYCGLDHGRMGFTVVVMEPEAFDGWLEANRR